ncbi:sensor histidine kinase [Olivibacter domesticus]|uniref:Histidine kinase n=1 Tax=Olivibacter domesticus TaxID=407022 RepID=A0A1H7Y4F9_OLID1|nr:histidine kinase [Olivibacter domesticus]SEM41042.1 Histidine kinase [Olivibacter domesticus]
MNRVASSLKKKKYHIIGWTIFLIYDIILPAFISGRFGMLGDYILVYIKIILFFYCHALVVLPFALKQQKNKAFMLILLMVLEYFAYVFAVHAVRLIIIHFSGTNFVSIVKLDTYYYAGSFWRIIYFAIPASAYYLFREADAKNKQNIDLERQHFLSAMEKKNIEKELIKSDYAYIRAQINPQFLFNLLDFLQRKTKKTSERGSKAISVLTEMIRYSLDDLDKKKFVLISDEIRQVEHLIYLNQLRFDSELQVSLHYSKEVVYLEIIPLVLLTLAENMFKHGDLITPGNKGSIELYVENDVFYIKTKNVISSNKKVEGYNAGLDNISKRLAFAYNNLGKLEYSVDTYNYFIAMVKIPLSSLANPVRLEIKNDGN